MLPNTFDGLLINKGEDVVLEVIEPNRRITATVAKVEEIISTDDVLLDEKWLTYKNKWRSEGLM